MCCAVLDGIHQGCHVIREGCISQRPRVLPRINKLLDAVKVRRVQEVIWSGASKNSIILVVEADSGTEYDIR
jgi:hypothetical protein